MKMISGMYWEKGGRMSNQDSVLLQQVMTDRGRVLLAAVSDGIGGLQEGEIAGGYILESVLNTFYENFLLLLYKKKRKRFLKKCMLRCFYEINQNINQYAKAKAIRLGATVSLLIIWKRRYMTVHLGDSRIYLCNEKAVKQLTTDHASTKGLTKCLGSFGYQEPEIKWGHIRGKKGFLLCTDGFYRRMDYHTLKNVLAPGEITEELQIRRRLRTLGESVLKKGEQDNCSALYIKVG